MSGQSKRRNVLAKDRIDWQVSGTYLPQLEILSNAESRPECGINAVTCVITCPINTYRQFSTVVVHVVNVQITVGRLESNYTIVDEKISDLLRISIRDARIENQPLNLGSR